MLASSIDQKKWIEDFSQLKQYISESYPNLKDVTNEYSLNLPELSESTFYQLRGAASDKQALEALNSFIKLFKDPHLRLIEEKKNENNTQDEVVKALPPKTSGIDACSIMGFEQRMNDFYFPTHSDFGFSKVMSFDKNFPSTILKTKDGKKLGFLRIASFHEPYYLDLCIDTWNSVMSSSSRNCDEKCQEEFRAVTLHKKLIESVRKTLLEFKSIGIDRLLVDVTFNGGGSDWVGAIMRMLTSKTIVCGSGGFTRGVHRETAFMEDLKDLSEKLKKTESKSEKEKIIKKIKVTENNILETKKRCDRSNVWKNGKFPSCSIVVKEKNKEGKDCSPGESYGYEKALYSGKLFILANSQSASATEDLIARHKESNAATIIGETTYGAGCGYTNGGAMLLLKNSGLRLMVPDCIRYLRSGRNEVVGIAPDINLDMTEIKTPRFTKKLIETLMENL